MTHPLHQFPQGCPLGGGHRVPGVSQVVKMQLRKADHSPSPVPEFTELRPAQPSAFRADEDKTLRAGSGEAFQVVGTMHW